MGKRGQHYLGGRHLLHRVPLRWLMEYLEPFLHDFWHSDLIAQLKDYTVKQNKTLIFIGTTTVFYNFYRVEEFRA
jgi:hypothetical protein